MSEEIDRLTWLIREYAEKIFGIELSQKEEIKKIQIAVEAVISETVEKALGKKLVINVISHIPRPDKPKLPESGEIIKMEDLNEVSSINNIRIGKRTWREIKKTAKKEEPSSVEELMEAFKKKYWTLVAEEDLEILIDN